MMKYLLIILLFVSCGARGGKSAALATSVTSVKSNVKEVEVRIAPLLKKSYVQGEDITVSCSSAMVVDSVVVVASDKSVGVMFLRQDSVSSEWLLKTSDKSKVGDVKYTFNVYIGKNIYSRTSTYSLFAGAAPKKQRAFVENVIPIKSYFLQGFEIVGDTMFFSSGVYGRSFVESVGLSSKKTLRVQDIAKKYFAEGLTVLGDNVYVLTWEGRKCLVYDRKTLNKIKEIDYPYAEGWGLTSDGKYLYMSDGTSNIYKIDPQTFKEIDRVEVASDKAIFKYINELEWINGEIWANVFTSNGILRIDPKTGVVKGIVDCSSLVDQIVMGSSEDFLNGIAFDKNRNIIYLSGKNWKKMFKVSVKDI